MKKHVGGRQERPSEQRTERGGRDYATGADIDSGELEKGGGPDYAKGAEATKKPGKKGSTGSEVTR